MRSLLILAALAGPSFSQSLADANKRYDAGDYHGAAAAYAELVKLDPRSMVLHYNHANALFKSGRAGRAIAAYTRAFDLLPRDPDIRFNLGFALKKAGEDLVPPGVPPALFALFYLLSERELAGLHWLACWAALLLSSLFLYRESSRPALGPWCATALGAWLLLGGWWLARRGLEPAQRGVIVASTAEIRSGPGDNFSVSFTAPEGRRVQVLSGRGEWLEIGVLKEGAKGWILAKVVETI